VNTDVHILKHTPVYQSTNVAICIIHAVVIYADNTVFNVAYLSQHLHYEY